MKNFGILILLLIMMLGCSSNHKADAYGSFEADEIIVSSEVTGNILQYTKSKGEKIEAGEVAAIIDTTNYALNLLEIEKSLKMLKLKIKASQQQLQILNTEKSNTEIDRERFVNLITQNAAPQKQLEDIDAALRVLENRIQLMQTNVKLSQQEHETNQVKLDKAKLMLEKCFVKAPIQGTILQTYCTAGEFAGMGKPIFKLANISLMKANFYISEPQLAQLKLGDEIKVYIDNPTGLKEFSAKITFISEKAEFTPKIIQTKDERVKLVYKVNAEVINDGSIKIGQPLEVRF